MKNERELVWGSHGQNLIDFYERELVWGSHGQNVIDFYLIFYYKSKEIRLSHAWADSN